jgi:hypothetical protein
VKRRSALSYVQRLFLPTDRERRRGDSEPLDTPRPCETIDFIATD